MLISEESAHFASQRKGEDLIKFTGKYPDHPTLTVNGQTYPVTEQKIEFQRLAGARFFVSVELPSQIETMGGTMVSFDPDLARVFGPLISVAVSLPAQNWLEAADKNCI